VIKFCLPKFDKNSEVFVKLIQNGFVLKQKNKLRNENLSEEKNLKNFTYYVIHENIISTSYVRLKKLLKFLTFQYLLYCK